MAYKERLATVSPDCSPDVACVRVEISLAVGIWNG